MLADLGVFWYKVRAMKKTGKKPSAKKPAAKAAAKKTAKPAPKTKAKPAAKSGARSYTPQPIQGIGWAPFRYPLT